MRVAFVLGRYGASILGGAEILARNLAKEAVRHGWDVEVWTTCAAEYVTWENVFPEAVTFEDGLVVRRFEVDPWNQSYFHGLNRYMQRHADLPIELQYDWIASGPHSAGLNLHVKREARNFDAIITMPYLGSFTYDASWLAADNAIVWPCLHQEIFAHMEPFRVLLESVKGVVYLSPEEARFANEDLGLKVARSSVIGSGVALEPFTSEVVQFDESPYLLYIGRLDHHKNIELLYEFVRRYTNRGGKLRLIVAGEGACKPPVRPEFEYLGPISDSEKSLLMANALATCQPSANESFSLVIMESWLARRPVIVWSGCEVTRGHAQRSKGGLWFGNYAEFEGVVDWFLENEEASSRMGLNGFRYVNENFTWDRVFSRFEQVLESWIR